MAIKVQQRTCSNFMLVALLALNAGLFFGVLGSLQYVLPSFLLDNFNFTQTRPLHVTLVITWIFAAASGGIYYYIQYIANRPLRYPNLAKAHLVLFVVTGLAILYAYMTKKFGGREYFEYPPVIAIPVLLTWVLFLVNFFGTVRLSFKKAPVYMWMWTTGMVFFLLTLLESYLWLIPYFRDNIVRDVTVQWKAMGSMVGSWNMLVYGTGFFVMAKISGNDRILYAPSSFFFFFLGLINLMFNWGHHTYIVPAATYVKDIAYLISMTELLLLGSIIWNWRKTVSDSRRNYHLMSYRLLSASDLWIFANLVLAIAISVPAINRYTHGTHITVAHAMGTTIGINTMILLASLIFLAGKNKETADRTRRQLNFGFWLSNVSLLFFWISLLGAGITKSMESLSGSAFSLILVKLQPWFEGFAISGVGVFAGLLIVSIPLIRSFWKGEVVKIGSAETSEKFSLPQKH